MEGAMKDEQGGAITGRVVTRNILMTASPTSYVYISQRMQLQFVDWGSSLTGMPLPAKWTEPIGGMSQLVDEGRLVNEAYALARWLAPGPAADPSVHLTGRGGPGGDASPVRRVILQRAS